MLSLASVRMAASLAQGDPGAKAYFVQLHADHASVVTLYFFFRAWNIRIWVEYLLGSYCI